MAARGSVGYLHAVLPSQLEQFSMLEGAISSSSLYSPGSTLSYSQAAMMGLAGSPGSLPDTQQLGYASHGSIPNIILTGEALCTASGELCHGAPRGPGSFRGDGAPTLQGEFSQH